MFREQLPAPPRLGRLHSILRGRRRTLENHSPICESAAGTGGSGQGHGPSAAGPALGGRKPPCLCVSSPALSLLLSYGSSCRIFGTVPRPSREGLSSSREAIRIAAGRHARWPVALGLLWWPRGLSHSRLWDGPARGRIEGPRSRTRRHRPLRVPPSRKRLRNVGIHTLRQGPQRSFLMYFSLPS